MKFKCEKKSMLTGETAVVFTLEFPVRDDGGHFVITARGTGVTLQGHSPELFEPQDFEDLAKAIGNAAREFLQLKPKLSL